MPVAEQLWQAVELWLPTMLAPHGELPHGVIEGHVFRLQCRVKASKHQPVAYLVSFSWVDSKTSCLIQAAISCKLHVLL